MGKTVSAVPLDKKLYEQVKAEMRHKYVWPSAYGSDALVKEYKRRGGRYAPRRNGAAGDNPRSLRHADVYELLESALDSTRRVEDLLDILSDIYESRSSASKYDGIEEEMRQTSQVLKKASKIIESVWEDKNQG